MNLSVLVIKPVIETLILDLINQEPNLCLVDYCSFVLMAKRKVGSNVLFLLCGSNSLTYGTV